MLVSVHAGIDPPALRYSNFNFDPVSFPFRFLRSNNLPCFRIPNNGTVNSKEKREFSNGRCVVPFPTIKSVPEPLLLVQYGCRRIWTSDLGAQAKRVWASGSH